MPEKAQTTTQPTKVKKPGARFSFHRIDLIIFLSVSAVLIIVCILFWIDFLASVRWVAGNAFGDYINLIGIAIAAVLLLLCFLLFIVRRSWRGIWIVWGVIGFFMVAGIGLAIGFRVAVQDRMAARTELYVEKATLAFQTGEQLLQDGKLELARSQFQYVVQLVPSFPGAMEKLVQVEEMLAIQLTPTVTPTPTQMPTVDTRNEDEIFNQAKQHMVNQEWEAMLADLETLRNSNPDYKVIEMDGLYYLALRMYGVGLISTGNLEEGIYRLNLAEKFAPLDSMAVQMRDWARLYLNAAAYWDVNWSEVVNRFAPIASALPNLMDVNHMTAAWRYVEGMIHYADAFAAGNDPCNAGSWYQNALDKNTIYHVLSQSTVDEISAKIDAATLECWGPTSAPVVETYTPTETTNASPSDTPTETDTPSP
jgi:tetratricopeptide (TPR) repeat protein